MTKNELKIIIGGNIRKERIARNLTINELSEYLDLSTGFVGLIERGRRGATAFNLYKLSILFKMDIDTFFTVPDDMKERIKNGENDRPEIITLLSMLNNRQTQFILQTIKGVLALNK